MASVEHLPGYKIEKHRAGEPLAIQARLARCLNPSVQAQHQGGLDSLTAREVQSQVHAEQRPPGEEPPVAPLLVEQAHDERRHAANFED